MTLQEFFSWRLDSDVEVKTFKSDPNKFTITFKWSSSINYWEHARDVCKYYYDLLRTDWHNFITWVQQIKRLILWWYSREQLMTCADNYAMSCQNNGTDSKYFIRVQNFYKSDTWMFLQYLEELPNMNMESIKSDIAKICNTFWISKETIVDFINTWDLVWVDNVDDALDLLIPIRNKLIKLKHG